LDGRPVMTYTSSESGRSNKKRFISIVLLAALAVPIVYFGFWQTIAPERAPLPVTSGAVQISATPSQLWPPPSFDAVSADASGMLIAAGKGPSGSAILVRNGDRLVGETKADSNGEWILMPERPLEPGEYVLSLLAKDPSEGSVAGKRTFALTILPRSRSAQRSLPMPSTSATQEVQPSAEPKASNIAKVKRGDSLWALAHRHLGAGNRYGEIVNANTQQIKNPNLIYPNQQFAMPR
jgi:nucleoid-associated protein YgaU